MPAETHSHASGAHDPSVVGALVVDRLAEILGRDIDDVRPEARLRDDLDADDLSLLDLFDAIEDELGERTVGIQLEDDDLSDLVTVADVVEYVVNVVNVVERQQQ